MRKLKLRISSQPESGIQEKICLISKPMLSRQCCTQRPLSQLGDPEVLESLHIQTRSLNVVISPQGEETAS